MTETIKRHPDFPVSHPGELLLDEIMEPQGLSVTDLASCLRVDRSTISRVTTGKTSISPDLAQRLELCVGASAEFWLGLQADYDLSVVRKKTFDVTPTKEFLSA